MNTTSDFLTALFTSSLIVGFLAWIVFGFYWVLKKFGVYKYFEVRSLRKRMKDYEMEDEIIFKCYEFVLKKWTYYDMKRYAKHELAEKRDKLLYTFIMLQELSLEELKLFERRGNEERNKARENSSSSQSFSRAQEEIRRTRGFYKDGKTSHYISK